MIQLIDILAMGVRDDSDNPLSLGQVYTYDAGTTTLKTTYQDRDLEDPHPNPIVLDANGRIKAWAEDRVKLVIQTAAGATLRTIDNVGLSDADIASASVAEAAGSGLVVAEDDTLAVDVDGSTLTITSNKVKIASGATLPGSPSSAANFTVGAILEVTTKLYPTTDTNAAVSSPGPKTISVSDGSRVLPVVTSIAPDSTSSLNIIRGGTKWTGAAMSSTSGSGEGWTAARNGTGDYTITFTTAFAATPTVTHSAHGASYSTVTTAQSVSAVRIVVYGGGSPADNTDGIDFIAIGAR